MNTIKQGILMATAAFIILLPVTYLIDGKIKWIIASGVASGLVFGSLVMYLWHRDGKNKRCD
ncbi:MAG: hypothetical protein MIO93_10185 [ANME-2 cluster archaeon]|nr:hypothetical protein [ANME-2 cluster archaeon]